MSMSPYPRRVQEWLFSTSNMHEAFIIFWHFNRQLYRNYYISLVCLDKPQTNFKSNY